MLSKMRVSVISGRDLTTEHAEAWRAIQNESPALQSPFYCPEFTMAVAEANDKVFVSIIHSAKGEIAGFFPFQQERPRFGKGLEMCDHQGVIALPSFDFDAVELIRQSGIKSWEFDHLDAANQMFRRFQLNTFESPSMDISHGFEAYKASLGASGKRHIAKAATSARKVQREVGPLTLVDSSMDSDEMQTMHRWREQKYGSLPEWSHRALEILGATRTPRFSGLLSALYAGEKLIAVHFGIRSRTVLHWWFPAYDPDFSNYAPGIQLMLKMAERAPDLGITKIDLGKGQQDYKRRFHNASDRVSDGSVDVLSLGNVPRILRRNSVSYIRNTPVLRTLASKAKWILRKG